jgi:hypothetical protein
LIHSLIRLGFAIREETRMNTRYHVELSEAERCELTALVGGGKHYARKIEARQPIPAAPGRLAHAKGEVVSGAMTRDLDPAPRAVGVKEDEEIDDAVAAILVASAITISEPDPADTLSGMFD